MWNPNEKNFDLAQAETALGIEDEQKDMIRLLCTVELLCAHVGITEEQIDLAYEQRIKSHITEAADNLNSLVRDD